jgi:phosphohistidine phosphatase
MRLILIRHCKSDWESGVDDHDRPLNRRGQNAATALGEWMNKQNLRPDLWLVSSALRTRATALAMREAAGDESPLRTMAELYHATPGRIIGAAQDTKADCLALVGHNPGIGQTARLMAREPAAHGRFADYPTGALTVLDFEGRAEEGEGTISHFIIPRDL